MVERHYDDEALLMLMEGDRFRFDDHLPSCTVCSEKLDTYRTITGALRHHDVWDKAEVRRDPVPATIASLRAFADRMSFEDAAAEAILPELLAGSREEWMPRLMAHPEWRTAGVVRGLVGRAQRAIDSMPPDAVELTALAVEVAHHLQPATYGSDSIARLQGTAWREHAYALFFVGDFKKAERAVRSAENAFARSRLAEYDLARLAIVRAVVLRAFERFDEAAVAAEGSAEVFAHFGDLRRTVTARMAEVHLMISRAQYHRAEVVLEDLERHVRHAGDAETHAHVVGNLGYAAWKNGRRAAAIGHYGLASAIFDALGSATEAARVRWNVAMIMAEEGRLPEAKERLSNVIREFDTLRMTSESALASLDLADLLLAESDFETVERICHAAMRSFERTGVAYTARAVTALGLVREAAQRQVPDRKTVRRVRDYIKRLPTEPALLFAELSA